MKNLSIKRLATVMVVSILLAVLPEWQAEMSQPLPADADFGDILDRFQRGTLRSVGVVVPALISVLVGFFVRADRTLPLNAVADIEEVR